MAANYWTSTQRQHWLFDREKLAERRKFLEEVDKSFIQQYPLPDFRLFNIYVNQQIVKLGKRMGTRQQALATAQVYIKRFYTKVEARMTNPYLVLTTAFYLACKTEECPQHIKFVVSEARGLWPEFITSDSAKIGECEFWIISELNSQLVVHHPYRALSEHQPTLGISPDEVALAWSVINDHYLTDLPLLHPPHVIAVMAIFVATVFKPNHPSGMPMNPGSGTLSTAMREGGGINVLSAFAGGDRTGASLPPRVQKVVDWLATGEVDIEAVIECTQEIVSLYEVWEQYSEKSCKEQVGRYVKSRGLEK